LRASADTDAAVAIFNKESLERFIFYNARFMQKLNQQAGEYWSLLFVLAHELGHHLAFHNEVQGRFHEFELEADKFAGFILRRMGATLEQTETAVIAIVPEEASETHPGQADRLQAIALGWAEGVGQGAPQVGTPPDGQQVETSIPTTDISYWHHNNSLMKLLKNGDNVEIHYQEPSRKMTTAINRLGSLLFSGLLSGSSIKGTAYVYSSRCNQKYAYSVVGQIDKNRIVLSGPAPDLNGCFHRGNVWNSNSELLFTN
jgi:hypothetical protein